MDTIIYGYIFAFYFYSGERHCNNTSNQQIYCNFQFSIRGEPHAYTLTSYVIM